MRGAMSIRFHAATGRGAAACAVGEDSGAAAAKTHGTLARSCAGACFAGACSGPSTVQMTNGEALAGVIAAGIQPAGRSARSSIAIRAKCTAADLQPVRI
jgi:hypothetical protein